MKIAVLCFHKLGGSGVVAAELGRELVRRGHRVHFVGAGLPSRLDPAPPGVTLHAVSLEQPAPLNGMSYPLALAARLAEVIRREKIDLIHAHYALPHALAASLAREALGVKTPFVLTLHGTDVPDSDEPVARLLVTKADAVTVPSEALAARARPRFGLARVEVIPNFVDTDRFLPAPAPPETILFHASNFRPVKRPLDLLRILERVLAARPARLVLAGDGPERGFLEAEVARLNLPVTFTGATRDVVPLLQASSVFLLPSAEESFGMAALEAMSCGVPVVGSRVGGLVEVVGEEGGVLLPAGDIEGMSAAVLRVLDDPRLRQGARARAVRLFRPGPILGRWEALYREVQV